MDNKYSKPEIIIVGDARDILQNIFVESSGDSFPGTEDALASS